VLAGLCPLAYKESDDDLLSQAQCLLSLARERFTVLFGMGRGGSTLLWSSDKGVRIKACLSGLCLDPAFELSGVLSIFRSSANCFMSRRFSPACLEEGLMR
jgi:hypothetical protein